MEKRRGRPRKPESERLAPLCTNVKAPSFDVLTRAAAASRKSLSELARDVLERAASTEFSQFKNTNSTGRP
jgi:hypothetical protein